MYRPTVRYDEVYRDYVDSLFHSTTLDRNQVIRLALFVAGHSKEFHEVLSRYKRADVPTLPFAKWRPDQSGLWLEQTYLERGEEGDVNASAKREGEINQTVGTAARGRKRQEVRRIGAVEGRTGAIPTERIKVSGDGISFTLN
jgi:hypothetical protein